MCQRTGKTQRYNISDIGNENPAAKKKNSCLQRHCILLRETNCITKNLYPCLYSYLPICLQDARCGVRRRQKRDTILGRVFWGGLFLILWYSRVDNSKEISQEKHLEDHSILGFCPGEKTHSWEMSSRNASVWLELFWRCWEGSWEGWLRDAAGKVTRTRASQPNGKGFEGLWADIGFCSKTGATGELWVKQRHDLTWVLEGSLWWLWGHVQGKETQQGNALVS